MQQALGLALCALLSVQAYAQTKPSYRFLANQNLAPLVMPNNGRPSGLVVELAQAMAQKALIPMALEATDWTLAQNDLAQGRADALLQINPNPARDKIFDFSEPLLASRFLLYGKVNDHRLKPGGDLAGLRVVVEAAGFPISYLKANSKADIVIAPNWAEGFRMVEAGQADALFVDEWVGNYALFLSKAKDILPVEPALYTDLSRIAVQKGNAALLAQINQGLQAIEQDGTKAAILDRWQGQEVVFFKRSVLDNGLAMVALAAVLLALSALAYFVVTSRRLRLVNEQLRISSDKLQTYLNDAICAQDRATQALLQLQNEQTHKQRLSQALAVYADAIERTQGVSRWDEQGRLVHVNNVFLAYSEYSREELIGQHRSILRHPDTTAEEVAALEQGLRQQGRFIGPWKNRTKAGQTRWSELLAVALPPNEHGLVETMALSIDQTALKLHSAALEKNRDELAAANRANQELLNAQESSVAILDRNSVVLACNEAYVKDFGVAAASVAGRPLIEVLGPELYREREPYIQRVLAGEVVRFEGRIIRQDGVERTWALTYTPRRDAQDHIVGFYACAYDITDAKAREQELQTTVDLLKAYMAAVEPFLIVNRWNAQGKITYVNDRFCQYSGYSREELLGADRTIIRHPAMEQATADQYAHDLHHAGTRASSESLERIWKNRTKSGDDRWCRIFAYTPPEQNGAPQETWAFRLDVTYLVRAEQAAQAAAVAKQQFLSTMSHELRTPLNGILGTFELFRQEVLSAQGQALLNTGLESGRLLMNIVGDVLDFSKIESGHLKLEPRATRLPTLYEQLNDLLQAATRSPGVQLTIQAGPGLDDCVLVDDLRLRQILLNLGSNALKFTHQGSVRITAERLGLADEELDVLLAVEDSGIGMGQAMVAKLFQPFTQADGSHTRQYGGTGLGLSIAQRLAQAMGSQIEVSSQEGVGSRFSLPLRLPVVAAAPETSNPTPQELPTPQGLRVLVVDDMAVNRLVACKFLASLGATTVEASDGRQAVDMLLVQNLPVDLVLMDLQMPGMGGLEAAALIRASGVAHLQTLPMVALTGTVEDSERERALAAGMNDFLTKPLQMNKLKAVLARGTAQATV